MADATTTSQRPHTRRSNARQPVHITQADLEQAYLRHRRRSWPPTLEACMADPLHAALVRLHAIDAARRRDAAAAVLPPARMRTTPRQPAQLDWKRRAAGDTDDV